MSKITGLFNVEVSRSASTAISDLTYQLSESMKKPGRKTLSLIEKALSYLSPFESPEAAVVSPAERYDLLTLLATHRVILSPYLDTDRIESHLRY